MITIPGCELNTCVPTEIVEGERYREDYGDLTDLMHSIESQGLINPISVVREGKGYKLVAGGRRLRACLELKLEQVPIRIFTGEVKELDLRLLELAENLQRKEMSWYESNRLQREIHRLQQERTRPTYVSEDGTEQKGFVDWSLNDTAAMLGVSKSKVQDGISIVDKMEKYQDVLGDFSKYKTENDARKAIKVVEEAVVRAELLRRAEERSKNSSFLQELYDSYMIGDCLEGMKALPDETFDFAEVDPPYGIDLDKLKSQDVMQAYNETNSSEYLIFINTLLPLVYSKLKDNTFCLFWFAADPWFQYIWDAGVKAGFSGSRNPIVWTKTHGQSLAPNHNLANAYEMAFLFKKGTPLLVKPGRINVFTEPTVPTPQKYHPTQKPLDLYKEIYSTFSLEGSKCLVPFAGSGASILAASLVGRKSIGWDLSEEYKGGYIKAVNEAFLKA